MTAPPHAWRTHARLRVAMIAVSFAIATVRPAAALVMPITAAQTMDHPALGPIPAAAQFDANGHLDPERAAAAYLNSLPLDKQAASNKYFEGGYWLTLWDAVCTIAIMLFLLYTGISARLRDFAVRRTRSLFLQAAIYFVPFMLLDLLLGLPLAWYEGFYRERLYHESHQTIGIWVHDQLIGTAILLIFGTILVAILYAIVRRLPRTWHLWGATVVCLFGAFVALIAPVFLAPLFNTYSRIQDAAVTSPILSMARANGIPVTDLYQVDASKQTTKVSANVSGLFGTTRITLNDNLLRTCSLEEIEDTTGHEMGHYVLHHALHGLVEGAVLIFLFFVLLRAWLESMQRRHGARWRTTSVADPALLPAVFLITAVIGLLATPLTNSLTRMQEREADLYGLNAAREPDASSQVDMKLGQYRKLNPTPLEEFLFFDHPSGHTRILDAMRWKSENMSVAGYK